METTRQTDYSRLDRPEILAFLFHPRPEWRRPGQPEDPGSIMIPVAAGESIGARFHVAGTDAPTILFFHGNGEIVSDYDELGPLYNRLGINFFPVDYRGYGRSTGRPTVSAMMKDCHEIFNFVTRWLDDNKCKGPLIIMGRSLGSASALELAEFYSERIDGLIIESGFAFAGPLMELLGIDLAAIRFNESVGFRNADKIKHVRKPTLIIHAEHDHIIPFSDGQFLYDACPSTEKHLLKIPRANHNDIFSRALEDYLEAVKALTEKSTNAWKKRTCGT